MAPLLAQRDRADRAFEKLYQRHVGDVYRYALVVMRNAADAEDITQTTFMNAYRAFARGERPRTPQNWLIAIAHNVCRQRFRHLQRRPNELPLDDDVAQTVPDDDPLTAEDIRRALSHLAFNQRAALVMRELEGRTYVEIAEVLDVSTSAVETLIFRARRALREQLEGGLTCTEAEFAVSRQLDGRLPRKDKGSLRAHLRECEDCARFARSQRAQRSAIRSLALIPVPSSLTSFFHHGGTAAAGAGAAVAGTGIATKVVLVGASAIVATGVGVEAARKAGLHPLRKQDAKAAAVAESAKRQPAQIAQLGSASTPTAFPRATASADTPRGRAAAKAKAIGLATAPGRLKEKRITPKRVERPIAPGLAKKPANARPEHAKRNAGPGGSVLRPPPKAKAKPKSRTKPERLGHERRSEPADETLLEPTPDSEPALRARGHGVG
jgi:RNA polymerase sigma factor (sigma-70 family)